MATYQKGTIGYMPVVDQINRKFTLRKNKCTKVSPVITSNGLDVKLEPTKYMGGMTTIKYRAGIGDVRRNALFVRENARSTEPSQAELTQRVYFSEVSTGVKSILKDLNQITQVQQKWMTAKDDYTKLLNGVSAMGYTFRGWIFAVQMAGKRGDGSYAAGTFPANWD